MELLTGNKPNLSKMHQFGTKCFAYKSEGTKKFDNKCDEGLFVEYDPRESCTPCTPSPLTEG